MGHDPEGTGERPRVLVLQHSRVETLGIIANALAVRGVVPEYVRVSKGQSVPESLEGSNGLILMGGPMGVYEQVRFPFLRDELRLIGRALEGNVPVLGVCLGSQLLAAALGARVRKGARKEIGWHRVTLAELASSDPLCQGIDRNFTAFHWHGDVFELPDDAVALASSDWTACQAFRYGSRAYGFLFHMEVTKEIIHEMVSAFAEELHDAGLDGGEILGGIEANLPAVHAIGRTAFGRWARLLATENPGPRPPADEAQFKGRLKGK